MKLALNLTLSQKLTETLILYSKKENEKCADKYFSFLYRVVFEWIERLPVKR